MSVKTEADTLLEEAREELSSSIAKFQKVLDPDTWGSKQYKDEFIEDLDLAVVELLRIKKRLIR